MTAPAADRARARRAVGPRVAALALALALALVAARARAQGAAADSALGRFLGGLADSTDAYFGVTATPVDTAGLDSAMARGLAGPPRRERRLARSLMPDFRFERVDGPLWGLQGSLGRARDGAELGGSLRWAAGPNQWLGGVDLTLLRRVRGQPLRLVADAGRTTVTMDRDHRGRGLSSLRALVFANDRRHYLRRDGFGVTLERESEAWRAGVGWSDRLQRPLAVTAGWSLTRAGLEVPYNLAARRGRAHELALSAGARLPGTPLELEVRHETSSRRMGSAFEYRRTRVALGGDIGLSRWFSMVPELEYGRLAGDPVPQAAFYLGGASGLRVLPASGRAGTGLALARLDLVCLADVLALMRIPHPAAFPILAGGFAAAGAAWGVDPFDGRVRPGVDWPHAADVVPEAGLSLFYQPGFPTPADFVRVDYAWALGPGGLEPRLEVSYSRALEVRASGR